jgi:NTE family protein
VPGTLIFYEKYIFALAATFSACSMGALIGGVYAAGKLDDFEQWIRAITKGDMVSLLDNSWAGNGLVKGDRIIDKLVDIVGDRNIEELPISYTAIAADVENEKEIWISSGRLFDAIRASISLLLFFTPVEYNRGQSRWCGGINRRDS